MMKIEQELREVLSKDAVIVTPRDANYKQAIKRWAVNAEMEAVRTCNTSIPRSLLHQNC
jgi:hypothetical protein